MAICVPNIIYRGGPVDALGRLSAENAELTTTSLMVIEKDRVHFIICAIE
jgi:hypothetical protein